MSRGLVAGLLILAGCAAGGPAPIPPQPVSLAEPEKPAPEQQAPSAAGGEPDEARRRVQQMLARVSKARGLPVKREVPARVLDRAALLARIRTHVDKEIPKDVVENEGELLAALELVPPEYDFVEGTYRLIQGRIAGFYEPSDHTMYLADDLGEAEAAETLAHELDHALQDQAFSLAPMIDYAPGDGDRTAAAHTIVEGDAVSAMLDVVAGSAFNVSEGALRMLMALSNATSDVSDTPHILQASLAAPYTDGFAFVQRQRAAGGWPAVDAALRTLPASTEQILHPDKLASREPPIPVARPTFAAIGSGFRAAVDDVVGEQGLLLMLEEWTGTAIAQRAAAGWGGDRYVVARRDDAGGSRTVAMGWHLVMDTEADAVELADQLGQRFGKKCRERPRLGPLAFRRRGRDLAIAAGPYARAGKDTKAAGSCAVAGKWIEEMLGK